MSGPFSNKALVVSFTLVQDTKPRIWLFKMAPSTAAVLRAPGILCSFSYVLFVFLLFYVLDVVSITVYDRDTLLNIGSSVAQRKPDFEFLNAGGLFTDTASEPFVWVAQSRKRRQRRKRGMRAGVLVRLRRRAFRPPLPTILLSNFQSLDNSHCGRASHTDKKQGTAVLFASQKPVCLLLFQNQPSSSRASPCTARIEQRSSQGKAEAGVFVSISTTRGVYSIWPVQSNTLFLWSNLLTVT